VSVIAAITSALALQHELEHLDGRLAIDLVTDPRSFCSVEEYEKRYRSG